MLQRSNPGKNHYVFLQLNKYKQRIINNLNSSNMLSKNNASPSHPQTSGNISGIEWPILAINNYIAC